MAIKNILFDLGNVLLDLELSNLERGFRRLMGEQFEQARTLLARHRIFELYETGGISTAEFLDAVCRSVEPHLSPDAVVDVWNAILLGFPPERFAMLTELRRTHSVFLLSNINELHADWIDDYMLRTYALADYRSVYFDGAYYSHLIRLRKPDADAFEYVLADAEIKAEETLFIDDLPANVAGATAVGLKALLKQPEEDVKTLLANALR
ncbi:MAG: HAD family phosphatase [Saprospiraceae bacterium]|nr:HAD family phosphatase [Saprospiraceae bacterium]